MLSPNATARPQASMDGLPSTGIIVSVPALADLTGKLSSTGKTATVFYDAGDLRENGEVYRIAVTVSRKLPKSD